MIALAGRELERSEPKLRGLPPASSRSRRTLAVERHVGDCRRRLRTGKVTRSSSLGFPLGHRDLMDRQLDAVLRPVELDHPRLNRFP